MEYRRLFGSNYTRYENQDVTVVIFGQDEESHAQQFVEGLRGMSEDDATLKFHHRGLGLPDVKRVEVNRFLEEEAIVEMSGGCRPDKERVSAINPEYL